MYLNYTDVKTFESIKIAAQINSVDLNDDPYENPWKSETKSDIQYLSTENIKLTKEPNSVWEEEGNPDKYLVFYFTTKLSDMLTERSRKVYNIVDMFAEVSGLADILFVISKYLMSIIFTKNLLK